MKKVISIILTLAMLFSFAACGQDQSVEQSEEKKQTNIDEMEFSDKITLMYYGKVYKPGEIIETEDINTITVLINGTSTVSAAPFEVYTDEENVFYIQKFGEHAIMFDTFAKGSTRFMIVTDTASEVFFLASNVDSVDISKVGEVVVEKEIIEDAEVVPSKVEIEKLEKQLNELKNSNLHDKYGKDPLNPIKLQYLTEAQMDAEVKKCKFPDAINKCTLTAAQARELADKDPAVIADSIKSVADAFVYFKTVSLNHYGEAYTPWYHGSNKVESYGYDHPGELEIYDNDYVCCGGMANLGVYVLQGDYDEVGVIKYIGESYHLINYIKQDGKYYVIDFVNLQPWNGWKSQGHRVTVLDDLHDFYQKGMIENRPYFRAVMQCDYEGVYAMIAQTADERGNFPCQWRNAKGTFKYPKECEGKVTLIYYKPEIVKDPENCVTYASLDFSIPGWNSDLSKTRYAGGTD